MQKERSPKEVARLLRVDEEVVRRWIRDGALPAKEVPHPLIPGRTMYRITYWQLYDALGQTKIKDLKNLWTVAELCDWIRVSQKTGQEYAKKIGYIVLPHTQYVPPDHYTFRIPQAWIEKYFRRSMTTMRNLLIMDEAVRISRLSRPTLTRRIEDKHLDAIPLPGGRGYRIPLSSLKVYLKSKQYKIDLSRSPYHEQEE